MKSRVLQLGACFVLIAATSALEARAAGRIDCGLYTSDGRVAGAYQITGQAEFLGTAGAFELIVASDGRYTLELGGPLANFSGYDGTVAWDRDWNGTPRVLYLGDHDESVLFGHLLSGAWLDEKHANSELHLGEVDREGRISLRYGDRGMEGHIQIDDDGQQVRAFYYGTGEDQSAAELDDFRDFDGHRWPARMAFESKKADRFELVVESVRELDEASVARSLVPKIEMPADHHFLTDEDDEIETVAAPSGHLLVHPRIDGQDMGWFIFDTGAGAIVLDHRVAKELGYEKFGDISVTGVGGEIQSPFYKGTELGLGSLVMDEPVYVGLDLSFLDFAMGRKIAGIIGFGVLSRSIVEIDMADNRIWVHDPDRFDQVDGNEWSRLLSFGRVACIPGRFEGHDAMFRLDTGAAGGTLDFHYPTVERLNLLDGRQLSDTSMGGVGGAITGKRGVIGSVEFGGQRFEDVTVGFATEAKGAFNDAYTDGNIGGQLLKDFRMVFDYPSGRMAFRPRF